MFHGVYSHRCGYWMGVMGMKSSVKRQGSIIIPPQPIPDMAKLRMENQFLRQVIGDCCRILNKTKLTADDAVKLKKIMTTARIRYRTQKDHNMVISGDKKTIIGVYIGDSLEVRLHKLLETRLLIQANSGGGKSYAIRRLIEQTYGKVNQLVFDLEGEFKSLREGLKFNYIGEPNFAEDDALEFMTSGEPLIVDLSELRPDDRKLYVAEFFETMMHVPKGMWQKILVVLDEAHVFAPQRGKSKCAPAVIDLATRGRKRGFCLVVATQRLSKLHKDLAAECLNKLIGRTNLDIDVIRAANELQIGKVDALDKLRTLEPGQFYAFGPAISDQPKLFKVGAVKTSHGVVL